MNEITVKKDITFAEIEELCIKAKEHQVRIDIEVSPEKTEIIIEPYDSPFVRLDTSMHP